MRKKLHLYVEEDELEISGNLLNCLVDMYVKFGEVKKSEELVARCKSDLVLCTTWVSGYVVLFNTH
jgi:hypothetical protein